MPYCPGCGEAVSPSQNFCRECGRELSAVGGDSGGSAGEQPRQDRERAPDRDEADSDQEAIARRGDRIAPDSGAYVTEDRVAKLADVLDEDETVHYLTRGSTVDVEGSSAGSSLFGDDRSRKTGTRGYVRAAITDRRVVVKVPQWLGSDQRSVPYQNVTSVDLDTGLVVKRLSLQTPGQTYHIEAHEPGKEEVREAVRFVRGKITERQHDRVVVEGNDGPDPTEQLQNLKALYDEGVLSEAEFEEKKQSLLEDL